MEAVEYPEVLVEVTTGRLFYKWNFLNDRIVRHTLKEYVRLALVSSRYVKRVDIYDIVNGEETLIKHYNLRFLTDMDKILYG